jgi:MATE family multidrug resistance protein
MFNETGDPAVQVAATQVFIFLLICQAFDALSVIFIGALRGAGDTLWPGAVQLALAYGLGLGGSILVVHLFPEWGSLGGWSVASGYIILLGLLMWGRFLGGKWRGMAVVETPAVPVVTNEAGVLPPV